MSRKLRFEVEVDLAQGIVNVNQAGKSLHSLGESGEAAGRKAGAALESLLTKTFKINQALELGKKAFNALRGPVQEFLNIGMGFEDLSLRFETVLQSAEKGKDAFSWVRDFSARTPFMIEELSESFLLLESFGIKGKEYLQTFGDTASGLKIPMKDLALVMGQVWSKPRAQTEEMLQLIERGVPVTKILKSELGLTAEQIGDLGRQGIEGKKVFEALTQGMQKLYGGAMEKMSQTGTGMLSTLKDKTTLFVAEVAEGAIGSLKGKIKGLTDQISAWAKDGTLRDVAKNLAGSITGIIDGIAKVTETAWNFKEQIIIAGKAFALYFSASKIITFGNAFGKALSGSVGVMGTLFSESKALPSFFSELRKEGVRTGEALKLSFSTMKDSMKAAGVSIGGLAEKIQKMPTALKLTLAFVGLELLDNVVKYIEEKFGLKYRSNGEFLGIFRYVVDVQQIGTVAADSMVIGPYLDNIEGQITQTLSSIETRFNVTKEEIQTFIEAFDIEFKNKKQLERDISEISKFFVELRDKSKLSEEQIGELFAKIDSLNLDFSKDRKEIDGLVNEFVRLNNVQTGVKDILNTAGSLGIILKKAYDQGSKGISDFIEKNRLSHELTKEQAKALESLAGKLNILTKEGYKSLNDEITAFLRLGNQEWDQFERNQKGVGTAIEMIDAWVDQYKIAEKDVPPALQKIYDKLYSIYLISMPKAKYKLADYFDLKLDETGLKNMIDQVYMDPVNYKLEPNLDWTAKFEKTLERISEKTKEWLGAINSVSGALTALGIISEKTAKGIDTLFEGAGDIANAFSQGALALGDFTSGNILGGLTNLGGTITSLVSGVGKLIEGISDLFYQHDWDDWTDKVNHAGIALGEYKSKIAELAEELRDDSMSTYDAAFRAFNQTLAEVISNVDVSVDSFEGYARSVHNILAQYDDVISGRSAASISETLSNLGDSFEALINKQRELGNHYSAEMISIMSDVETRGLHIASINKYIAEETEKGFAAYKSLKDSLDSSGIEAEINEITQAMLAMKKGSDEWLKAQEKLQEYQKGLIDIQNIQAIFGDASIEMFDEMYAYQEKVAENELLVKAIRDWETSLISYTNVWKINENNLDEYQVKFDKYTKTAKSEYEKLIEAGFDQNEALETLAPTLQRLAELQAAHGFAIDDSTQAMIDQAREQGLLSEQTQSDQRTTNQLLLLIAEGLGVIIPDRLRELTGLVGKEVDTIVGHTGKWTDSLDNVSTGIKGIGGDITTLDELWSTKVHGNTITASNDIWAASLVTIQDELGGIGKWITKIDRQDAWDSQTSQTSIYMGRLEEIATLLGVTIPAEYDTLEKRHAYLMEILKDDIEELQTLWDHFKPEDFNLITPEMRSDDTDKFRDLISIWTEYGDTISADQEALQNFYDALAGLNVTDEMLASWQEFLDQIGASLGELPTTIFDHFDPSRYNLVTPEMQAEDTDKFNELIAIWEQYGETITGDSEALQQFYNDLAGLNVSPEMQASWETLLDTIEGLNNGTAEWHGLTLSLGDSFDIAGRKFTSVTSAMISDEEVFAGYLDSLMEQLGIDAPDAMTSLSDRWAYVMGEMGYSMSDFVVDANGQIMSLSQAIRQLGKELTAESGFTSQWGIYTEEEKQTMSATFAGMRATWAAHRDELVSSPGNLAKFYADLEKLVVTDDFQDDYSRFLTTVGQWNRHIQRGDTLDTETRTWTPAPESEDEKKKNSPSRPRPAAAPTPSASSTGTATGGSGSTGSGGGDTYIFNTTAIIQGGTGKELVLEFIDHLRNNKWGLTTAVTKVAREAAKSNE